MAPRFTGGGGASPPPPPVKRLKAQTSDKFPDIKLQYLKPEPGGEQLRSKKNSPRNRPLMKYLILDARYEKARHDGVVRDVAVLSAIGIGTDKRRHVLGLSVALSEAEVHWRAFLESLQALHGTTFIVSDAGLKAARRAVLGAATWQRCQFHLAQTPCTEQRHQETYWKTAQSHASSLQTAEAELGALVASYRDKHPSFADWLENNAGLAVFTLPDAHRKRMRTSNGIERPIQQELKRRTSKVRVFPNLASLERLSTAALIDEKWETETKIKWEQLDQLHDNFQTSGCVIIEQAGLRIIAQKQLRLTRSLGRGFLCRPQGKAVLRRSLYIHDQRPHRCAACKR